MNLKEIEWKKYFTKKHCIIYASILLAVILTVVLLIVLLGGNGANTPTPQETTPAITTPAENTPAETTPAETTVTYPAEGEIDPGQEDVFFD